MDTISKETCAARSQEQRWNGGKVKDGTAELLPQKWARERFDCSGVIPPGKAEFGAVCSCGVVTRSGWSAGTLYFYPNEMSSVMTDVECILLASDVRPLR